MQPTVEKIRDPDVHTDVFSEMVCDNLRIRHGNTKDISE